MASESPPACALCGKPANNKCTGCKTETESRHYCGTNCQKKDWPTHKKACISAQDLRLGKLLERVAGLVQEAYYNFRENTWETPIVKIEDRDDALVLTDGVMLNKTKYFLKFPQHMVTSQRTKAAMLCAWVCNEPLAFMHELVAKLLQGELCINTFLESTNFGIKELDVKVEEISLNLGRIPRKTTYHTPFGGSDDNWPKYSHEVLRVNSSKSKKQWVIDISGAQYGLTETFWVWETYANEYMVKLKAINAFGFNETMIKDLGGIPGNPSMAYGVIRVVAKQMNHSIKEWATERGISLSDLPKMGEEDFRRAKNEFLQTVSDAVREFINVNSFDKEFQAAKVYEKMFPGKSAAQCHKVSAKHSGFH